MPMTRFATLLPTMALLLTAGAAPAPGAARFIADGAFIPPSDYREWVYMSTGLDMSYSYAPPMPGQSMFDNVFVDPASWRVFKKTGHRPEGAVFILENRGANSRSSINKHGQ